MKQAVDRSTLFLTELIIDLFIFIVCAAVCVGLLVRANVLSRSAGELTDAVYIAQTAAEAFRTGRAPANLYRADGTPCLIEREYAEAAYSVTVTLCEQSSGLPLQSAEISVYALRDANGPPCYTLTVTSLEGVSAP